MRNSFIYIYKPENKTGMCVDVGGCYKVIAVVKFLSFPHYIAHVCVFPIIAHECALLIAWSFTLTQILSLDF